MCRTAIWLAAISLASLPTAMHAEEYVCSEAKGGGCICVNTYYTNNPGSEGGHGPVATISLEGGCPLPTTGNGSSPQPPTDGRSGTYRPTFVATREGSDQTWQQKAVSFGAGVVPELMNRAMHAHSVLKATSKTIDIAFNRIAASVAAHVAGLKLETTNQIQAEPDRISKLLEFGEVELGTVDGLIGQVPGNALEEPPPPEAPPSVDEANAEKHITESELVRSGMITGTGPDLVGLLTPVRESIYAGISDPAARDILFERDLQLRSGIGGKSADDARLSLRLAEVFRRNGNSMMSQAMLRQAKAYRYARELGRDDHQVVYLDNNDKLTWSTEPPDTEAESVIDIARRFSNDLATFDAQATDLRQSIGDAPDRTERLAVLTAAEQGAELARRTFSSGDVSAGEHALGIAVTALDLATNFVPELSAARSAYQLLTGKDLITGQPLGDIELGICVLDLATLGHAKVLNRSIDLLRRMDKGGDVSRIFRRAADVVADHFPKEIARKIIDGASSGKIASEGGGILKRSVGPGIRNPLPSDRVYARVMKRSYAEALARGDSTATIGGKLDETIVENLSHNSKRYYAFISAREDLAKLSSRDDLTRGLSRYEGGTLKAVSDEDVIFEFKFTDPSNPRGLMSPIGDKWNPGFIEGGRTEGGLREWVIPNDALQEQLIDISTIKISQIPPH